MSNYRQLLLLCVKALSTYDYNLYGIDDHLENFLHSSDCNLSDDSDRTFVSEVFSGCVRYQALIKVVVDGFYTKEGRSCLRADSNLYSVLAYIVMFRLEELGMGHLKRLVNTQHIGKMHRFLSFLYDKRNLKGWIHDEWCRVYDKSFVETRLMSPMLRFDVEMKDYIQQLEDKLANRTQKQRDGKPVTETKAFNLTKPRPRSVPTPEKIPKLQAYRTVPKSTYSRPSEEEQLAKAFHSNRKRAEDVLLEANKLQISCASTEKSEKTKRKMEDIIAEREERLQHAPIKPTPIPSSMKESRPVKLNAAAILREGARIQRHEEEEEQRLASLEAGQRDGSEYVKWQEEVKQREAAEKLAEIEQKHLKGQLIYEEAIIARQNHINENRERVQLAKEESETLMRHYFAQREEEQREMRSLVEATMAGHQSTKESRQKLQLMKQKIVQQVAKESQELMARALEEAEAEMRRKAELIQQIRAMESVPIIRTKFVDFTTTSGSGLLAEMSVVELRERLSLMKIAEAEEEEKKRREIVASKQAKEQLLSETLDNISRFKAEQTKQSAIKQEQQKQTLKKHQENIKDKKLTDLQEKLEAKRRERERLKQSVPSMTPARARQNSGGSKKSKQSTSNTSRLSSAPAIDTLLRTAQQSTAS